MSESPRSPAASPVPGDDTYRAIVQKSYGSPAEVLRLVCIPVSQLVVGSDDILVAVKTRVIHPGDVAIIKGASNGGTPTPIQPDSPRVPGFEGVGVIEALGEGVRSAGKLAVGQRVAFFSGGARSWAAKAVVPAASALALPDELPDAIGAQILINTVTAKLALRAGHNSLPPGFTLPVTILQTAAGSAVGRLISRIAIDLEVRPVRLVRTKERAISLAKVLPGDVVSTDDAGWKDKVRAAVGERPLYVAIDAVGGKLIEELMPLLKDGGTIVNFGWLGDGAPDLSSLAPHDLTLKGVSIGSWARLSAEERAADLRLAIDLGLKHPELFEVAAEFPMEKFQEAIRMSGKTERSAAVLLKT